MRLVVYKGKSGPALGLLEGDDVVDVAAAGIGAPADLTDVLNGGWLDKIKAIAGQSGTARQPLSSLTLLPLTMHPGKTLCLGLNYVAHANEVGVKEKPDYPVVFMRAPTSFIGPFGDIIAPKISDQVDWEGELVAFIGKGGKHISEADALDHVAGYAVFNDVSIRDIQLRTIQWTVGKNFDSTGPFGPAFVTADELPAGAEGLKIQTRLNGEVMQDSVTSLMVFKVAETIAILSQAMTLEPGDLLVMGTPAGVGNAREPKIFMKPGDTVEVEIEKIGIIRNKIVAEV